MKILIWCVCIVVLAAVQVLIKNAGIILGAIPTALLYGGCVGLASWLCTLVDKQK